MKLIPRWIIAFATALIFCSPLFAQTATPAAAPDGAWWSNDNQADGISMPRFGGVVRTSRYVKLRDGVRLAIDIYLPEGLRAGERMPTILEQTRYRRS